MTRRLLFLLFFVLLAADMLGVNLSLLPGISMKNAFLYVVSTGIAIDAALARNRRMELPSVIVPYALCILYATFTWLVVILIMDYPGYRVFRSLIALKSGLVENLLVFLIFFYGTLNSKDALWLLKMILWTVVIGNVISVMDALNLPDLGLTRQREDGRIGGIIGESNQFAAFLALFLPGAVALYFMEHGWRRALAVVGFMATGLAFLMTASRGGAVGVVGGGALALFLMRQHISARALASSLVGATLLAIVIGAILIMTGYWELIYNRFNVAPGQGLHSASSGRTFIWTTALSKMAEFPVTLFTGFGWDTYRQFPDFGFATHNEYLKIYFELGVIGLFLVLVTFANVVRIAISGMSVAEPEARPALFAFAVGFACTLVAIFFVNLYGPWLFIWAYTGVAMRLSVVQTEMESRAGLPASRHVASRSSVAQQG